MFMSRIIQIIAALIIMSLPLSNLSAQEPQMSGEVKAWFVALSKVSRPRFRELIDRNARIELKDLGIVQTREEFLDSLEQRDDATKGAILLTQVISSQDGVDIVEVCYRFDSNEQLSRETYRYLDGRITSVIQERLGTNCVGFF